MQENELKMRMSIKACLSFNELWTCGDRFKVPSERLWPVNFLLYLLLCFLLLWLKTNLRQRDEGCATWEDWNGTEGRGELRRRWVRWGGLCCSRRRDKILVGEEGNEAAAAAYHCEEREESSDESLMVIDANPNPFHLFNCVQLWLRSLIKIWRINMDKHKDWYGNLLGLIPLSLGHQQLLSTRLWAINPLGSSREISS